MKNFRIKKKIANEIKMNESCDFEKENTMNFESHVLNDLGNQSYDSIVLCNISGRIEMKFSKYQKEKNENETNRNQ